MTEAIVVAVHGRSWAIKHNGGYLGYANNQREAVAVAQDLIEWLVAQGRSAELLVEHSPEVANGALRSATCSTIFNPASSGVALGGSLTSI